MNPDEARNLANEVMNVVAPNLGGAAGGLTDAEKQDYVDSLVFALTNIDGNPQDIVLDVLRSRGVPDNVLALVSQGFAAGAGGRSTTIYFPGNMLRLTADAPEEIGGMLFFKKQEGDTLQLYSTTYIAGNPENVDVSEHFAMFRSEMKWCFFHTHPVRDIPQYMGLSGGDLNIILKANLTSPGANPTVTHMLFTPMNVMFTVVEPKAYYNVLALFNDFVSKRAGVTKQVAVSECLEGIRKVFELTIDYIRTAAREPELLAVDRTHETAGKIDRSAIEILDKIKFLVGDPETIRIFDYFETLPDALKAPYNASVFFKWFYDNRNVTPAWLYPETAGLFYTWTMPINDFRGTGRMGLVDQGHVYDDYVETRRDIFNVDVEVIRTLGLLSGGGRRKLYAKTRRR